MPTALVVGATGMIGLPVSQLLASSGWNVFGTVRKTSNAARVAQLTSCGVKVVEYDMVTGDPATLPQAIDVVVFLAWDRSHHLDCPNKSNSVVRWCAFCEQYVYHLNYFPSVRLLSHLQASAHVLNASSLYVLGDGLEEGEMYHEGSPLAPTSTYGRCRADLEEFLQRTMTGGTRHVNLRYLNPQDPQHSGFLPRLIGKVSEGQEVDSSQRIQLIDLGDVVQITAKCAMLLHSQAMPLPLSLNVCHPEVWAERALAELIRQSLSSSTNTATSVKAPSVKVPGVKAPVKSMVAAPHQTIALLPALVPVRTIVFSHTARL